VQGGVVVDETRYDAARAAPAWESWQIPTYVGPLSAFEVDDNRDRTDAAYIANPALGNGEAFKAQLAAAGVTVAGPVTVGRVPADAESLTWFESPPIGDLLDRMLMTSDNEVAELLTREAGVRMTGTGSSPAGTEALEARLMDDCAPLVPGHWSDGSGLSRADLRSARELRRLMQFARDQRWWPDLVRRLPVAGRSGTLIGRFRGTPAEGRVIAKTGTIIGGSALTGVVKMTSGRRAVFSVLVNGDGAPSASRALDDLVVALAAA
jgi:D-alanyl-D-alanine carboxypeptidase/D-alanyl-D-alanine-endopeptidase (penicillin-binding protein 4)